MDLIPLLNRGELEPVTFGWWVSPDDKIEQRIVRTRGGSRIEIKDFEARVHCGACGMNYIHPQFRAVAKFVSEALNSKPWDENLPTSAELDELRSAMIARDLQNHLATHGWTSEEAPPYLTML